MATKKKDSAIDRFNEDYVQEVEYALARYPKYDGCILGVRPSELSQDALLRVISMIMDERDHTMKANEFNIENLKRSNIRLSTQTDLFKRVLAMREDR